MLVVLFVYFPNEGLSGFKAFVAVSLAAAVWYSYFMDSPLYSLLIRRVTNALNSIILWGAFVLLLAHFLVRI